MKLPDWLNIVNVAAAMAVMHYTLMAVRWLAAWGPKAVNRYYKHICPPGGFNEAATLTVKVVGAVKTRPDGSTVVERFE